MVWKPVQSLAVAMFGVALFSLPTLPILAAADAAPADTPAPADQEKNDLEAIQKYLAKEHPKVTGAKPFHVDSDLLKKAYPGCRFYCIKMIYPHGMPIPPEVLESQIDLVLSFDAKNQILPRTDAKSFNAGLMKVATDDDSQTAAAAIMSLLMGSRGLQAVAKANVTVTAAGQKRSCSARVARNIFTVEFDAAGACITAKNEDNSPPVP